MHVLIYTLSLLCLYKFSCSGPINDSKCYSWTKDSWNKVPAACRVCAPTGRQPFHQGREVHWLHLMAVYIPVKEFITYSYEFIAYSCCTVILGMQTCTLIALQLRCMQFMLCMKLVLYLDWCYSSQSETSSQSMQRYMKVHVHFTCIYIYLILCVCTHRILSLVI